MTGGAYFGKYQRKPKEENALRDVSKRTEHRLLREKEREREREEAEACSLRDLNKPQRRKLCLFNE